MQLLRALLSQCVIAVYALQTSARAIRTRATQKLVCIQQMLLVARAQATDAKQSKNILPSNL